ncbi:hypothetical protein TD95_004302 [Thielaviopsis punctulata]|uniref:Uncharacterized protein n=1 Tax=Thielaviopsis punctulata TaxID=72032 RepID=A0A0F4Z9I0_9PEZI|nr:hypothetical protein TD95_004302 [Thielaviopsis punctulata]
MDFAPYQAAPPETGRSPFSSPRTSLDAAGNNTGRPSFSSSPTATAAVGRPSFSASGFPSFSPPPFPPIFGSASPPLHHPQPQRIWLPGSFPGTETDRHGPFETSLGFRLAHEAALAYLALPPLGALVLLALEHKSDYVRFHAWQAALLFTAVAVMHYLVSWSGGLSMLVWMAEVPLIGWLAYRAYYDADSLDRYEVPFVGAVASHILDDE